MNLSKILFFLLITQIFCFKDHYGQTFIWTRPLYSFFSIQQNMWFDLTFNRCNKFFQFIGLEQKTVKSKFLNKYFFFNKPEVYITSKNANIPETERIRSQWLDIEGDFEGSFSIEPEAERKGFLAMWRIDNLGKDRQHRISFLNNSWIAVMIPFEFVKHKLNTYYKSSKKDEQGSRIPFGSFSE